jgi:hypothetical protein
MVLIDYRPCEKLPTYSRASSPGSTIMDYWSPQIGSYMNAFASNRAPLESWLRIMQKTNAESRLLGIRRGKNWNGN